MIKSQGYTKYQPVTIASDISEATIAQVEEYALELPGVSISNEPVRTYPNKTLAAHILGYIGKIPSASESQYLNNEEIKDKPLRMDPTGDGFIGVVLDDGTFEPLKVSLETFTIIPNEAKNILANIESENIENKVINNINIEKDEFVNSINVAYDNSVSKYKEEYIKPLNDILKTTKTIVNNIINEEDTISVVTKQGSEYINNIKDIKHDIVSNISGIETTEVIESIDILKDYGEVVDDVKLNKDCVNAVNDIYVTEQKFASCINEKIKGNLEFVRNGIMLINDDGELTIYSTNKISSINK